jgi:methionyl-tRNA formyltransferase
VSGEIGTSPRVAVFGYHDIGTACLEVLLGQGADVVGVVTHKDDPAETIWFASIAKLAAARGIPTFTPEDPNESSFVEEIRRLQPELLFSFYYRQLLGQALLDLPRLGAMNLHGSLLPKYRGRAPINWALVHGETISGVTLHYMDPRADHGDIIAQRAVSIAIDDTALTLSRKLTEAARRLLAEAYPLILAGRAPRIPQDHTAATRFGRRRPSDGLIDWSASAWQIYNLIRAVTHPFPGAFTFLGTRRVFLWAARPPAGRPAQDSPGRILGVGEGASLAVATGGGVLDILRIQVEDGPEMGGEEFAATVLKWGTHHESAPCFGGGNWRQA